MAYGNILLISDRSPIFPDLARLLAQAGYGVTLTFYGLEAFQALRTGDFPVVISRLSKDWSDKRPFLEAVREPNREISLLFLRVDPEFGSASQAYLIKTDGQQFKPQGWGGLRHLVTNLSKRTAPSGSEERRPSAPIELTQGRKHSLLEFRRKRHAPGQHTVNQ